MRLATATFLSLLILSCAPQVLAKAWRGVIPLESTRDDVVRLFKHCNDDESGCEFTYGNETVYIVFSSLTKPVDECEKNLRNNTVLRVEVKPRVPLRLSQFSISKKNFRQFDPSEPPHMGYRGYFDETAGLIIQSYKGRVLQLQYLPVGTKISQCPGYFEQPERLVSVFIEMMPPMVSITCPTNEPVAGERITFSATTSGHPIYKWRISAGKIIQGQGTYEIIVDTTGLAGQKIQATIERYERKRSVVASAMCTTPVTIRAAN